MKQVKTVLPVEVTPQERAILDRVNAVEALRAVKGVLSNDQKNTVLTFENGERVYLGEYINAALENAQIEAESK